MTLADFEHFGRVLLLDVKVEQLVLQVLVRLAAVDYAVLRAINFEQEEHIVLINLAAIITVDQVVDRFLDLLQLIVQARLYNIGSVPTALSLNLGVDSLLLDQVALE